MVSRLNWNGNFIGQLTFRLAFLAIHKFNLETIPVFFRAKILHNSGRLVVIWCEEYYLHVRCNGKINVHLETNLIISETSELNGEKKVAENIYFSKYMIIADKFVSRWFDRKILDTHTCALIWGLTQADDLDCVILRLLNLLFLYILK